MPFYVINIFLGFAGFLLALYIAHKKRRKSEHFVCPLRGNCSEVIHSDYSKFFGIPVEYLGLAYYGTIAVAYGLRAMWPGIDGVFTLFLFAISTFALVFSFYLTFIQLFTLRKICTWCLVSATLTVFIFAISLSGSYDLLVPVLASWKIYIVILHVIAMAVGLGAATLADLFFFRFLKDFRISEMEASVLRIFSQFIWLALGLIIMTGLGLFIPQTDLLLSSDKFLMKMIVVSVIIVNGAFLNLFIAPKILQIQFGKHHHQPGELVRTRQLAFMFGPISVVSWYVAFILGMLETAPATLDVMWRTYLTLIIVAVLIGQIAEKVIDRRASGQTVPT